MTCGSAGGVPSPQSVSKRPLQEEAMAKGQMRSNKEKKKPKAEKDKKVSGAPSAYASQYASGQSKPNQNPFAKKG
jgi:hypothetical protein